jgi:ABC-2 type transport system ATP-binding protein
MSKKTGEVIRTVGLTKYYGASIGVEALDVTIPGGEIFGFLGPNGAGKTTTIRLLLGLLQPTSGSIRFYGKEVGGDRRDIARSIGYLPGDVGLYRDMTGAALLNHFLKLRYNRGSRGHKDRLGELKGKFRIDFDRKIVGYSKGMRQIVGIIQAFMHDPRIVILDEPTAGLDPIMQERFCDLLLEERDRGKTIFLSTHILGEVERVCDRVGIIKKGRLVFVNEIDGYRSTVGKNITIVTGPGGDELLEKLRAASEIGAIDSRKNVVKFHYKGDMQRLLGLVSSFAIRDFTCEPPGVEDLFLNYYKD